MEMVHLSSSTALYLATATLLGAVVLPASLDFAATELGGSAFPSRAQSHAVATQSIAQALSTRVKPVMLTSAGVLDSE
jgi:hypothetical protein